MAFARQAALAAAIGLVVSDAVGITHTPIARSPEYWAARKPDPCKCLNWKEVFNSGKAKCGMGMEHFRQEDMNLAHRRLISNKWNDGLCDMLYSSLNSTSCANANMGEREGQWCYVKSGCGKLNQGWRIPGNDKKWSMSVKLCTEGQDTMLKDMMPPQMKLFATKNQVDVGMLMKMAYPTVVGHKWDDVKKFWSTNRDEMEIFPRARAEEIALTGAPVIWGSKKGNVFGVTQGKTAYKIEPTLKALFTLDTKEVGDKLSRMTCVRNCQKL